MSYEKLWETQKTAVQAAIDLYPGEFGLKAFPGDVFRVEPRECFWSELESAPMLYVYVRRPGTEGHQWSSFAKGTPEELRRQTVIDMRVVKEELADTREAGAHLRPSVGFTEEELALLADALLGKTWALSGDDPHRPPVLALFKKINLILGRNK